MHVLTTTQPESRWSGLLWEQPVHKSQPRGPTVMAEELRRKKRIRAGHRGSATRTLNQVEDVVWVAADGSADLARLTQLRLTLAEKLETLRQLD